MINERGMIFSMHSLLIADEPFSEEGIVEMVGFSFFAESVPFNVGFEGFDDGRGAGVVDFCEKIPRGGAFPSVIGDSDENSFLERGAGLDNALAGTDLVVEDALEAAFDRAGIKNGVDIGGFPDCGAEPLHVTGVPVGDCFDDLPDFLHHGAAAFFKLTSEEAAEALGRVDGADFQVIGGVIKGAVWVLEDLVHRVPHGTGVDDADVLEMLDGLAELAEEVVAVSLIELEEGLEFIEKDEEGRRAFFGFCVQADEDLFKAELVDSV